MTLLDLRRYAIRNQTRIHFKLESAGECVVDEHGILKFPSLRRVPDFSMDSSSMDSSLASVDRFTLAPVQQASRSRHLSREQLASLLGQAPKAGATAEE